MKPIKKYFLLVCCFVLMPAFAAYSQSGQLEREIRIAERIIEEIFSDIFMLENEFQRSVSAVEVRSEYIPGTGVHFLVNENQPPMFGQIYIGQTSMNELVTGDSDEEDSSEEGKKTTVDIADIEERILEYLTNYSAQLQSLESGEVLRISFGINSGRNSSFNFNNLFRNNTDNSKLPALSLWIAADDVRRFRDAELTKEQFLRSINRTEMDDKDLPRDVTIFSSILETALQDAEATGLFISQNIETRYLPDWGAEFTVNIRTGNHIGFNISETIRIESMEEMRQSLREAREDLQRTRVEVGELDILSDELRSNLDSVQHNLTIKLDSLQISAMDPGALPGSDVRVLELNRLSEQSEISDEDILKSRELIEELVVSVINDYGSTLSSLSSDEFLKITLKWRGRQNVLPEETQFFIRKSELDRNRDVTVTNRPRS